MVMKVNKSFLKQANSNKLFPSKAIKNHNPFEIYRLLF